MELKAQILPYDEVDFSRVLDALFTRGYLVKYAWNGITYGWIPSFRKHQFVNPKEAQSELPPPPETVKEEQLDASSTRDSRVEHARLTRPSLPVHSSLPVPNPVPSPERGSGGKPDLPHAAIRDRLNALFKREPSFPWGNDEEHYLLDVAKRPNCLAEMAEIEAFWAAGNYRPQSVRSLLDGWPALLDRARNHRENMARNAKPKHQPESGQREEHIVLKRLFAS